MTAREPDWRAYASTSDASGRPSRTVCDTCGRTMIDYPADVTTCVLCRDRLRDGPVQAGPARARQAAVWIDDQWGYRCPGCAVFVCVPRRETPVPCPKGCLTAAGQDS